MKKLVLTRTTLKNVGRPLDAAAMLRAVGGAATEYNYTSVQDCPSNGCQYQTESDGCGCPVPTYPCDGGGGGFSDVWCDYTGLC